MGHNRPVIVSNEGGTELRSCPATNELSGDVFRSNAHFAVYLEREPLRAMGVHATLLTDPPSTVSHVLCPDGVLTVLPLSPIEVVVPGVKDGADGRI